MAKYIGSACRLCRREGEKLFLKGTRCSTFRCAFDKRSYAPGQHGNARKTKLSNYGMQLREKQKVKRIYGILEKQFRLYFKKASQSNGITGSVLLQYLERRLDSVVFHMGVAASRRQARQMVSHGFIYVNSHRVNIASFLVKEGDEIVFKMDKKCEKTVKENLETMKDRLVPGWLLFDAAQLISKVTRMPAREDIAFPVNEQLIVELYSR